MSRLGFYIVRIYSTLRDALTKEEEEEHLVNHLLTLRNEVL